MKFSVLVSIYFKENPIFFRESLLSVYNKQSLKPDEIVLICDGVLTDELNNQIIYLKSQIPVLKVFSYKINKGLGYALNYGISKCSNELIFRMDADDISRSDRFEKQVFVFKNNPNLILIGSSICEFNHSLEDLNQFRIPPTDGSEIYESRFKRNPFNHMTVGFKKSKIKSVGGYKTMYNYEDYYLWLRLLKVYDFSCFYNSEESLVYARIGTDFFKRRSGLTLARNEYLFQKTLFLENIITLKIFLKNIILRVPVRLLPQKMIYIMFSNFLRKK